MKVSSKDKQAQVKRLTLVAAAAVAVGMFSARGYGEEADPKVTPEIVARVTEFFKKVDAVRRPKMDERMDAEIQDIAKATGLNPEGVKTLQGAARQAEDAAQAEQLAGQIKEKPAEFARYGETAMQYLDKPEYVQAIAAAPETIPYTAPTEEAAWKASVARVLTPEQNTAWEKTRAERDAAASKEAEKFIDGQIGRYRPGREQAMDALSNEIITVLQLPKARADAVRNLATKAVDTSMDRWRQQAVKAFLAQSAAQRAATLQIKGQTLNGPNFYVPFREEDSPEKLAAWTEGIAKELTDAERARLQSVRETQRTRSVHVLGEMLVALLDEKLALTAEQRTRLQPLAERLVQTEKDFFPAAGGSVNYYTYSPGNFYKTAATAKPEEVRPILDAAQFPHWETLKDAKPNGQEDDDTPAAAPGPLTGQSEESPGEPEDLEQTVADYLQTHAAAHRREVEADLLLRAEDARRVAALSPETFARLRTAAEGATEEATDAWLVNTEANVRSSLQGATRENLPGKIAGISSYYFQQQTQPQEEGVWTATIKAELTEAQRAAWEQARKARAEYHDAAVGEFLMARFDRMVGLSAEQWPTVQGLVTKAYQDYRPDIERMFSYSNNLPWYLSSYYMLLPLRGIPEAAFKAVLTPEQWTAWTGSSDYSNTANYWDNIQQSHDSRLKQAEQQAKKKKP